MKRASDDVPDDWSPLLGSVNHVDRILDERPFAANIGRSTNCHALVVHVYTGRRPNDVDLAALTHRRQHSSTTSAAASGARSVLRLASIWDDGVRPAVENTGVKRAPGSNFKKTAMLSHSQ